MLEHFTFKVHFHVFHQAHLLLGCQGLHSDLVGQIRLDFLNHLLDLSMRSRTIYNRVRLVARTARASCTLSCTIILQQL